jgi:hypothetical protein
MERLKTPGQQMRQKIAQMPNNRRKSQLKLSYSKQTRHLAKYLLMRTVQPVELIQHQGNRPAIPLVVVRLEELMFNHGSLLHPLRLRLPEPLNLEDQQIFQGLLSLIEHLVEAKQRVLSHIHRLILIGTRGACRRGPIFWMTDGTVCQTMAGADDYLVIAISVAHLTRLLVTAGVSGVWIGISLSDRL